MFRTSVLEDGEEKVLLMFTDSQVSVDEVFFDCRFWTGKKKVNKLRDEKDRFHLLL